MLRYLVIRDFALIESLELKFESGLNDDPSEYLRTLRHPKRNASRDGEAA